MRPPVAVSGPVSIRWTVQSGPPGGVMQDGGAVAGADRQVLAAGMKIKKELDDRFFLVTQGDDELVHPVGFVMLHDMPDDRLAADLDEGLGPGGGFLR